MSNIKCLVLVELEDEKNVVGRGDHTKGGQPGSLTEICIGKVGGYFTPNIWLPNICVCVWFPDAFVVSMQHCSEHKDVSTLKYEVGLKAMNTNKNIQCNQFML
jgi:hypothetical protein